MKVRRGVEVALNHHLFTAKLKLKLTKNWMETTTNMKIYNVSNRCNILQDLQGAESN